MSPDVSIAAQQLICFLNIDVALEHTEKEKGRAKEKCEPSTDDLVFDRSNPIDCLFII